MADIDTFSCGQLPSTASSRSHFTYQTQRVIYNFLRLVPSSLAQSPADEVVDPVLTESCVLVTPLLSQNPVHEEDGERVGNGGSGDSHVSRDAETDRSPGCTDRQGMFEELRTRVNERSQRREADAREMNHRASQIRKVLQEFMEKVREKDRERGDQSSSLAPVVTIIKKNSTLKFPVEPVSPSTAEKVSTVAGSLPLGNGQASVSPFSNPLCSSTPSLTPHNDLPPVCSETSDPSLDQMSDSSGAYLDIDMLDDIELLVNAGVVPSVSKSLKDEISSCLQNLESSRPSKRRVY